MRQGLQRFPWDGAVREFGTLWTFTNPSGDTVRCFLTTQPHGWDLRLERDSKLVRTQTFSDADALLTMAETWHQELSS